MHTSVDYGIVEDRDLLAAKQVLLSKITIGKDRARLLVGHVAKNIPRDRYVPPHLMRFEVPKDTDSIKLAYAQRDESVSIHRHALSQLAQTAGLPLTYVRFLNDDSDSCWKRHLLAFNLNRLFEKQDFLNRLKEPAEFLHRLVGDELRAFLTQSYNRHLMSMPLLNGFLEACQGVGAEPVQALVTDTRVGLQCYLPYAFQPLPNEFIAVGAWWGNSDFGDGRLKVSHTVLRIYAGSTAVMEDSYSRVHLGSVVRDSDITLSDEVAVKEIDTVCTAIKDAVRIVLSPDSVRRLLIVIKKADEEGIPWKILKTRLAAVLTKEEIGKLEEAYEQKIVDLPSPGVGADGTPLASKWWTSSALAWLADKETDIVRQTDLRQAAGKHLGQADE